MNWTEFINKLFVYWENVGKETKMKPKKKHQERGLALFGYWENLGKKRIKLSRETNGKKVYKVKKVKFTGEGKGEKQLLLLSEVEIAMAQ